MLEGEILNSYSITVHQYVDGNWRIRSCRLHKQTISFYEGRELVDFASIIDCNSYAVKPILPPDSPMKRYPLVLQLPHKGDVYLNATTDYHRLQFIDILNRASQRAAWNTPLNNSIAAKEIELKIVSASHPLASLSIDRTQAKLTELYKLRIAALSERKRIEDEDQAYKDQLDKRRADMEKKKKKKRDAMRK